MVKRILLNQTGLKFSKPGIDVETANPFDLLFNSDLSFPEILLEGFISNAGAGTIPFGFTLPSPPFVWFYNVDPNGSHVYSGAFLHYSLFSEVRKYSGGAGYVQKCATHTNVWPYADRFEYTTQKYNFGETPATLGFGFKVLNFFQ